MYGLTRTSSCMNRSNFPANNSFLREPKQTKKYSPLSNQSSCPAKLINSSGISKLHATITQKTTINMVTKLIVSPVRFQTTNLLHGHIQIFLIQFQFNAKFLLVKNVYLFVKNQIRSGTCDGITFQFLDHVVFSLQEKSYAQHFAICPFQDQQQLITHYNFFQCEIITYEHC